jgi:hypothetical protein
MLNRGRRRALCVNATGSVVARWAFVSRFGSKRATLRLMSEWLTSVAAQAGYDPGKARVLSVQLGATDSRCELEMEFSSLSDMETFWSLLPPAEHTAWLQQLGQNIVDGSSGWTVLQLEAAEQVTEQPAAEQPLVRTAGGLLVPQGSSTAAIDTSEQPSLDWKGEPIVYRPGDRLPRIV